MDTYLPFRGEPISGPTYKNRQWNADGQECSPQCWRVAAELIKDAPEGHGQGAANQKSHIEQLPQPPWTARRRKTCIAQGSAELLPVPVTALKRYKFFKAGSSADTIAWNAELFSKHLSQAVES
jgi:hypothetical protein